MTLVYSPISGNSLVVLSDYRGWSEVRREGNSKADEEDEKRSVLVRLREEGDVPRSSDEWASELGREEGEEVVEHRVRLGRGLVVSFP